jgi:uncharacterized membrane protein
MADPAHQRPTSIPALKAPDARTNEAQSAPSAVLTNIDSIIRLEKEDERERSLLNRIAETIGSFGGTVTFVLVQVS